MQSLFQATDSSTRHPGPGTSDIRHHDNRIADEQLVRSFVESKAKKRQRVPRIGELIRIQVSTRIGSVKDFPSKADARDEATRLLKTINQSTRKPDVRCTLSFVPDPARTALATAAFAGIRRGEIAGLLCENFDPQKCQLNITRVFGRAAFKRREERLFCS